MEDRLLVERARRGDELAFESIVRRHTDTVWRFARSMVRDHHAAEEVVQDTFLKAHRGLESYRGDGAMSTWLYTICRRTVLDRTRRSPAPDPAPLDAAVDVSAETDLTEDRLVLEAAIEALPFDEREAFVLTAVLGYSREDAAAIVGIPSSTMRSRIARARTRLALALTSEQEEPE